MATATIDNKIKNALNMYNTGLQEILPNKFVGKVNGKDLSTNDFTNALKEKLEALSTETQVVDASAFTDTFVTKVNGKDLSTNDFTDAYKEKLEALSTDTQVVDLTGVARFYVGPVAPTDTSVIWFDTSAYLDE